MSKRTKKRKPSKIGTLLRMLGVVKPLTSYMILAVVAGTLAFLAVQFIPILGGYAILSGLGLDVPIPIRTIWILLPVLALLRAVLRFAEQRLNHYIAFTLLALVRDKVFGALRRLCPAKLEGKDKGDLVALITSDVELLEVFYAHTISPICIALVTSTIMCVYIGTFHTGLGLLALAAYLCVGIVVPLIISGISGSMGEKVRKHSADLASCVLENIRGLDETIHVLMTVCAGWLYTTGKVGFDGFLIPVLALLSSFGPVSALASLGTTLQNTVASGARVLAILDEEPETEEITGKPEVGFHGAECRKVSFGYGSTPVLRNFSLSIHENQIIGIVGESGCGKSTLLKLLMRFWAVNKGRIGIVDIPKDSEAAAYRDIDLSEINTSNLRDMESYMTQDTQMFKDTIAGNIRIGKLDATKEEVEAACRKASLHDWIMTLPDGYETDVGELGDTLSGGERQRVGLARAFLHDAPFMLLDEPTSNLDSLNEAVILKALRDEAKGKTVLLVSHRKSTMRVADVEIGM